MALGGPLILAAGLPGQDGGGQPDTSGKEAAAEQQGPLLFELPPGPAADAVARVRPDTEPAVIPGEPWPDWSARGADGWGSPEPWRRWAALVREEAAADAPDPARRAQLALCARAQGRDRDAWSHLANAGAEPALTAALLPRFLPGMTTRKGASAAGNAGAAGSVLPGGLPGDLRSGDWLRPPLPPEIDEAVARAAGIFAPSWKHHAVRVGESRVSVAVELSIDGVEIELLHLSGPPVELTFALPSPRSQTIRYVYANWEKVEDATAPVTLNVSAEVPEGEIWGRFLPRATRWPEALPPGLDARVRDGEVRIVGDVDDAFLGSMASGLGALLGTTCKVVAPGTPPEGVREPLSIHLGSGPDAEAKLLGLLSRAEVYALRRSPLAPPDEDG